MYVFLKEQQAQPKMKFYAKANVLNCLVPLEKLR